MSWNSELAVQLAVIAALALTGWQDFIRREASNAVTIPFFIIGVGTGMYRFHDDPSMWYVFSAQIIITICAMRGWMGGADWKMQCGLFGLWPFMGVVSLLAEGVWGLGVWVKHDPRANFPKLSVMAAAVILTFILHLSIMFSVQFLPGRIASFF
jgi:hypothetical protein